MTITVLSDVIVPNGIITAGARGKNMRRNTRATNLGGSMNINIGWSNTLRQYEIGIAPMLAEQWQHIEGLHEITEGGAFGMLLQDPKDSAVDATTGILIPYTGGAFVGTGGRGFGVPTFKLAKRYTVAGSTRSKDRPISRPLAGALLRRNGALVTQWVDGGGYGPSYAQITLAGGLVTFQPDDYRAIAPGSLVLGATTQFSTLTPLAGLIVGGNVWMKGLAGADAALINDKTHLITAITGAGPTVYTIALNTLGKAITIFNGTAEKYAQIADVLTWQGPFYVPVHFENDDIDWELVRAGAPAVRLFAGPSVMLMEVRE